MDSKLLGRVAREFSVAILMEGLTQRFAESPVLKLRLQRRPHTKNGLSELRTPEFLVKNRLCSGN